MGTGNTSAKSDPKHVPNITCDISADTRTGPPIWGPYDRNSTERWNSKHVLHQLDIVFFNFGIWVKNRHCLTSNMDDIWSVLLTCDTASSKHMLSNDRLNTLPSWRSCAVALKPLFLLGGGCVLAYTTRDRPQETVRSCTVTRPALFVCFPFYFVAGHPWPGIWNMSWRTWV